MGELLEMPGGRWQGVDRGFTVTKANFHFFLCFMFCWPLLCSCSVVFCSVREKKRHIVACCVMFFAILQPQLFFSEVFM